MKVYTDLSNFTALNPVVTIGTFDGVHLGHKKVIKRLQELAKNINGETVIFTFYPHPKLVLDTHNDELRLINTLEEKKLLLEAAGVDHLVVYPFTKEFAKLSYTDFVEKILVEQIGMKSLVIGYDHKFGHKRQGTYKDLKKYADKFNFNIEQLEALNVDAINVSSTKIRKALSQGDIQTVNAYLGHRYFIKGLVVDGKKIGREIGFPTANIDPQESYKLIPKDGVYAVKVEVNGAMYAGMLNVGFRPTVNHQMDNRSIEVNIFDFDQNIYYKNINIHFYERIRDEQVFKDITALKEQLIKDKQAVLELFKSKTK